jgi:hypothetical protein
MYGPKDKEMHEPLSKADSSAQLDDECVNYCRDLFPLNLETIQIELKYMTWTPTSTCGIKAEKS